MRSTSTKEEDLKHLLKIVAKGKYNDGRQHDAPEFYDALIDTLREEIKKEDQDVFDVIVLSLIEEDRTCIECGKKRHEIHQSVFPQDSCENCNICGKFQNAFQNNPARQKMFFQNM